LCDLLRDKAQDGWVDAEEVQVDGRNAVLSGQHGGDHLVTYEPKFDEIEAETTTVLSLVVEGLSQVLRA
jgi:hypothetical protein